MTDPKPTIWLFIAAGDIRSCHDGQQSICQYGQICLIIIAMHASVALSPARRRL